MNTDTNTTERPTTKIAAVVAEPPPPTWPLVRYDGTVWSAFHAFKCYGEWTLRLRTGKRPPTTVPARLCQWSRP